MNNSHDKHNAERQECNSASATLTDYIHEKLQSMAEEVSNVAHQSYTKEDIYDLQRRLSSIDHEYKHKLICGRHPSTWREDLYEYDGRGQVADELSKMQNTLQQLSTALDRQR